MHPSSGWGSNMTKLLYAWIGDPNGGEGGVLVLWPNTELELSVRMKNFEEAKRLYDHIKRSEAKEVKETKCKLRRDFRRYLDYQF